jgi:formylglycine-generating enzyme required for sulfatase activity
MRAHLLAAVAALAACGPTTRVDPPPGSILLYIDTDAPIAAPGVRSSVDEPSGLFDRVRVEVFAPGRATPCDGCTNEFPLDPDKLRALAFSVGVAPPQGVSGFRARVRMFLAAHAKAGEPAPDGTVDVTVSLPPVDATGKTIVTLNLATDDVGVPVGSLDAPVDPDLGPPTASRVATWPRAARVPCAAPPDVGEVCIPGGAFWMGGRAGPWTFIPGHDTLPPRLVVLSPFYIDAHEVTVAEYRSTASADGVTHWHGGTDGTDITDYCTFTPQPMGREDMPVNCGPWPDAELYCTSQGKELPTEAQHEYLTSGLVGSTFVWGEDPPSCDDAVFSRVGWGYFSSSVAYCKTPAPPGGAAPVGSGLRDRLALPTGTVVDLAGNVAEWLEDRWNRSSEPCWSRPGVYVDPVCTTPSLTSGETDLRAVGGGDWLVTSGELAHTIRVGGLANRQFYSPEVGFRCARRASQ